MTVVQCTCRECRELRQIREGWPGVKPTTWEAVHNLHTACRQLGWALAGWWLKRHPK